MLEFDFQSLTTLYLTPYYGGLCASDFFYLIFCVSEKAFMSILGNVYPIQNYVVVDMAVFNITPALYIDSINTWRFFLNRSPYCCQLRRNIRQTLVLR